MRNFLLASVAIIALIGSANAASVGGNLSIVGMQSGSQGAVQGGGANAGLTAVAGVTASQTTQKASTTGVAGTQFTQDKNGTSLVSSHDVKGKSSQTTSGLSLGLGASGGIGASTFTGVSASQGSSLGLNGFLGF